MARSKTFDRETVLAKAMDVFWAKGYESTSMQDLVEAMGIHRGSLYDTFKDKRHLFLAAIAHYNTAIVQESIAPLQVPGASRPAIERYLIAFAENAADPHQRGCMITNSIIELAAHDPEVATSLHRGLRLVEDAFYRALGRAQDKGEIAPHRDLRSLSQYLTSSLQGLRVTAKVNHDREALRQVAQLILQVL
ncbi:MAG: TetR/AcrR family transcriptional regulator [Cyanobacteria bacterium P01_F01_bin.86]